MFSTREIVERYGETARQPDPPASQPDTPRDEYTKYTYFFQFVCSVTNVDVISFLFLYYLWECHSNLYFYTHYWEEIVERARNEKYHNFLLCGAGNLKLRSFPSSFFCTPPPARDSVCSQHKIYTQHQQTVCCLFAWRVLRSKSSRFTEREPS